MLRVDADPEAAHHLEGRRIDDVDVARAVVGNVDPGQRAGDRRAELAGGDLAVEVGGVDHRRHARHGVDAGGAGGADEAERQAEAEQRYPELGIHEISRRVAVVWSGAQRLVAFLMASTLVATMRSTPSWPSSALALRGSPWTPSAGPSLPLARRRSSRTRRGSTASSSEVSARPAWLPI